MALRLSYAFRKAYSAMLVTSMTTSLSFLATCFSPSMPICSFGIFAAIVILVNYLLIIVALPNIYLFNEYYIAESCCSCKKARKFLSEKLHQDQDSETTDTSMTESPKQTRQRDKFLNLEPLPILPIEEVNMKEYQFKKYGRLMKFFDHKLARFTFKFRKYLLSITLLWLLATVYFGLHISQ